MRVIPKQSSLPIARVDIYYSVDPDPRARFWRDAGAQKNGEHWEAKLPVLSTDAPLYAFANAYYTLPKSESLPHSAPITEVCLSAWLHTALPAELKASGVLATDESSLLIDDFARGWHDWYRLNAEHKQFWQNWTRKVTDPKWRGPDDTKLAITLTMPEANTLSIVAIENEWRSYRGKKRTFVCQYAVSANTKPQTIVLSPSDFKDSEGQTLNAWSQLDQLGLCATSSKTNAAQGLKPPSGMAIFQAFID